MHYTPDHTKALPYTELHKQVDIEEACAHYIDATYGQGVVYAIPTTMNILQASVVHGIPEINSQHEFIAYFGLAPKPTAAQELTPQAEQPKAKRSRKATNKE
ncbi:hypothetical protein AL527_14450 [Pseudomonas fulva]|uniref:hypothetical protein n=1 Tax=Pseudomonas fulva TaxID=47880 RepID=UPI000CE9910D|nr:hypothetical protein [Pseudomonas fulva]AVF56266.1 hypothetical protein AL527_14450 [Pseudomonas fulva]